jgi:hypothetical protein
MVRLEPTAKRVVDQLAKYGAVAVESPTSGYMRDEAGGTWRWEVFLDQVTFTREDWRTRTITADKVSEYMFKWMYNLEDTRPTLEFPMTIEECVEMYGIDAVYRAFLRYRAVEGVEEDE